MIFNANILLCCLAALTISAPDIVAAVDSETDPNAADSVLPYLPGDIVDTIVDKDPFLAVKFALINKEYQDRFQRRNQQYIARLKILKHHPHLDGISAGQPPEYHRFLRKNGIEVREYQYGGGRIISSEVVFAIRTMAEEPQRAAEAVRRLLGRDYWQLSVYLKSMLWHEEVTKNI